MLHPKSQSTVRDTSGLPKHPQSMVKPEGKKCSVIRLHVLQMITWTSLSLFQSEYASKRPKTCFSCVSLQHRLIKRLFAKRKHRSLWDRRQMKGWKANVLHICQDRMSSRLSLQCSNFPCPAECHGHRLSNSPSRPPGRGEAFLCLWDLAQHRASSTSQHPGATVCWVRALAGAQPAGAGAEQPLPCQGVKPQKGLVVEVSRAFLSLHLLSSVAMSLCTAQWFSRLKVGPEWQIAARAEVRAKAGFSQGFC